MSSLSIMATFVRKYFARAFNNSEAVDGTWWAALDAMLADQVAQGNQLKARVEAISTAAGSLRYNLTQQVPFTATALQTAFTVGAYDNVNDLVEAFTNNGAGTLQYRIPDSLVSKTSSTVITLPAQAAGALVTICIRSVGNGTSQLASTTIGQGSALVGFSNPNGLSSSVNVEAALAELFTDINSSSFLGGILTLTGYLKANGANPLTGNLPAGGNKITGLGAGTSGTNDAARMADITSAALQATLAAYLSANYLPLTTGQIAASFLPGFTGDVTAPIGSNALTIGQKVITPDRLSQANGGVLQSGRNGIINGAMLLARYGNFGTSTPGATGYGGPELIKGSLTGTTVAGTLQQGPALSKPIGPNALTSRWGAVTITGAGTVIWQMFIESKDAIRFTNLLASFGCWIAQYSGGPMSVTASVYKANGVDNFAGFTLLGQATATALSPTIGTTTPLWLQIPGVTMGDCSNGIVVNVVITSGSVASQNFDMAEAQLEPGPVCTPCEYEPIATTEAKISRYFEALGPSAIGAKLLTGLAISTTQASFAAHVATKRATPTISIVGTGASVGAGNGVDAFTAGNGVLGNQALGTNAISFWVTITAANLTVGQASNLLINDNTTYIAIDCRF